MNITYQIPWSLGLRMVADSQILNQVHCQRNLIADVFSLAANAKIIKQKILHKHRFNNKLIFLVISPLTHRSRREQTNTRINVNGGHVQQCNKGYKHETMVALFTHCFVIPPNQLRVNSLPTAAT